MANRLFAAVSLIIASSFSRVLIIEAQYREALIINSTICGPIYSQPQAGFAVYGRSDQDQIIKQMEPECGRVECVAYQCIGKFVLYGPNVVKCDSRTRKWSQFPYCDMPLDDFCHDDADSFMLGDSLFSCWRKKQRWRFIASSGSCQQIDTCLRPRDQGGKIANLFLSERECMSACSTEAIRRRSQTTPRPVLKTSRLAPIIELCATTVAANRRYDGTGIDCSMLPFIGNMAGDSQDTSSSFDYNSNAESNSRMTTTMPNLNYNLPTPWENYGGYDGSYGQTGPVFNGNNNSGRGNCSTSKPPSFGGSNNNNQDYYSNNDRAGRSSPDRDPALSTGVARPGNNSNNLPRPPLSGSGNSGIVIASPSFFAEVLAAHNKWRGTVVPAAVKPLENLKWDDQLARLAEIYASQCPERDQPAGARRLAKWPSGIGQNIAFSSWDDRNWTAIVDFWADERLNWAYGFGSIDPNLSVEHYTVMIAADSLVVGCAKSKCNSPPFKWRYVWVCNYAPTAAEDAQTRPYQAAPQLQRI